MYADARISNIYFRSKSKCKEYNYIAKDFFNTERGQIKANNIPVFSFKCEDTFDMMREKEILDEKIVTVDNVIV